MRTRLLLGALGGISLTAGAAFALASVWFPTPSVSISTLAVPAPDSAAVIVQWTKRCISVAGASVCPRDYYEALIGDYGDGKNMLALKRTTRLRDTIRFERPLCPQTLKVQGAVAAHMYGGAERSNTGVSLWQVIRCSEMTPTEKLEAAALADSFPSGARRITMGDWAYKTPKADRDFTLTELLRASKTKADSLKHRTAYANADAGADSLRRVQVGDTLQAMVGYEYRMCLLGKNRYTGAVVILDGGDACEAPRARWASERSG